MCIYTRDLYCWKECLFSDYFVMWNTVYPKYNPFIENKIFGYCIMERIDQSTKQFVMGPFWLYFCSHVCVARSCVYPLDMTRASYLKVNIIVLIVNSSVFSWSIFNESQPNLLYCLYLLCCLKWLNVVLFFCFFCVTLFL